jgi:outer membrane protein assembly factor BamB
MKFPITLTHRKHTASFRIVGSMLAIAPLCLMLAAANTSAYGQMSGNVSNSASSPSPADWTQFLRDNMQRWNASETVLGINNVGNLHLKWKNPIGPYFDYVLSSPAVVNGVVYFGSDNGILHALNASTGATLWNFNTGNIVVSSPAVANGIVYIGSYDGNLYALSAATGTKLWSFATQGAISFSSPTVANGVVYIGSNDHSVYALNASTGEKLWSYATGDAVEASPAVANGAVYVPSDDGNVYALNASTGAKLWNYTVGPGAGESYMTSSPSVANGVVYVGSGLDSSLHALDAGTGTRLWSYSTGSVIKYASTSVANGVVYIGCFDGSVHAVNASTGTLRWKYLTGAQAWSSPAVANGVVYVGSLDGNVYALNASTGAKLWSYNTAGNLISSPSIVDGVLYVRAGYENFAIGGAGTGNIYAFAPGSADLFLRITPTLTTVHQGDLLTYAFPVWDLGPANADHEALNTQVPAGTTFDYIRISGTPGLSTCTHPPYQRTGQIVCHENGVMAANTTWTVRLTVKVTAPAGTVITENAATMADTPDPNLANNTATVSLTVQ